MNEAFRGIETMNAVIDDVTLTIERGFMLSSFVFLNLQIGGTQGFGGFHLGALETKVEPKIEANIAAEWICGVLRAADSEDFFKLKGRTVRVRRQHGWDGKILEIGHVLHEDRWFNPTKRFEELLKEYS